MSVVRIAAVVVCLIVVAGARSQCVPGPFAYDVDVPDAGAGADTGPVPAEGEGEGVRPGEGEGDSQNCVDDRDCPGAICTADGVCIAAGGCPILGGGCAGGLECAYDITASDPLRDGECRRPSPDGAPPGLPCDAATVDVDPCAGAAFCLPNGGGTAGTCVEPCGAACSAGTRCGPIFADDGGAGQLCLPTCGDADPCDDGVCVGRPGAGTCDDTEATCARVDGVVCTDAGQCGGGQVCRAVEVQGCVVGDGVSVCGPAGGANDGCDLGVAGGCGAGLSCQPDASDGAHCVTQSQSPLPDGATCVPRQTPNPCAANATCVESGGGGGVCMRFCATSGECGASDTCVVGHIAALDPVGSATYADVKVCASGCSGGGGCTQGLTCDVDDGGACGGAGFCLGPEGRPCINDGACGGDPNRPTCTQGHCAATADACVP